MGQAAALVDQLAAREQLGSGVHRLVDPLLDAIAVPRVISGPTSVSGSSGSPTVSVLTLATRRSVKAPATSSWTSIRWIEMQLWPAWEKAWICALSAAASQSPSVWTISGALEPSSRLTFLWGTRLRIPQPTSAEPVKVSAPVSSCSTIALPTSEPGPGMTLSQPSGRPASTSTSASFSAEIGVWPAGLRTTALPAAIAGPSLWATRLSGKLKGLIAPTTP